MCPSSTSLQANCIPALAGFARPDKPDVSFTVILIRVSAPFVIGRDPELTVGEDRDRDLRRFGLKEGGGCRVSCGTSGHDVVDQQNSDTPN